MFQRRICYLGLDLLKYAQGFGVILHSSEEFRKRCLIVVESVVSWGRSLRTNSYYRTDRSDSSIQGRGGYKLDVLSHLTGLQKPIKDTKAEVWTRDYSRARISEYREDSHLTTTVCESQTKADKIAKSS